jgi:hypothetical protein
MAVNTLTREELEHEVALELPERETLALVVIRNVLNGNRLRIRVDHNNVALQVCAQVDVINTILGFQVLTCRISQ